MQEVKIFEQEIMNENTRVGKIAIFRFVSPDQKLIRQVLSKAVSEYIGYEENNQFIEINLDNPALRVIIKGIDEFAFEKYTNQRL